MVARDPSRLGQFTMGYGRLGVYHPQGERRFKSLARDVTWRVAVFQDRDTYTGIREPSYPITRTIKGVFEERAGELVPLPSGYAGHGGAVIHVFDAVKSLDQILLPESNRYYRVGYVKPDYRYDHRRGLTTFNWRVCDLDYLEMYVEG
jgi:hypothetical protein